MIYYHVLTYRPSPCSNVFMFHTLRFGDLSFVIFYYFMASLILSSHLLLCLPCFSFPALACFIGVNHPAIVREIPHVSLFPAFPHFLENVPHFLLYFEKQKNPENRDNSWRQKEFLCVIQFSPVNSPNFGFERNFG